MCNLLLFFMEAFNLETVEEHSKGHWVQYLQMRTVHYFTLSHGPFQSQPVTFIESRMVCSILNKVIDFLGLLFILDDSSLNFLILYENLRPFLVCGWHYQRQVCTRKLQCCRSNAFSHVSEARTSTDSSVGYHGKHLYIYV